jgi:predicted amidohydrolase
MKYNQYSHRHGKELLEVLNKPVVKEIQDILNNLEPFPHGSKIGTTAKNYLTNAFIEKGWTKEGRADFNTDKSDFLDLCKWKVAIEMEFSRFEMFFRDFFRFMLMFDKKEIDVGIIITLDELAYERWGSDVNSYRAARASF